MTRLRCVTTLALSVLVGWAAPAGANAVAEWNAQAVQCITMGFPGTPTAPAIAATRGGPPGLLDLAIVHLAMHDAVQAIEKEYQPYKAEPPATGRESVAAAAAAAAAYRVLSTICPNYQGLLDAAFKPYLDGGDPGLEVGYAAGDALLEEYRPLFPTAYTPGTDPGDWQPTPPGNAPFAFVFLATTKPFTLDDPWQFRAPPPPPMNSLAYLRDFNEVKRIGALESHPELGSCPAPRRTDLARFWSGNFFSQWNESVRLIALDHQLSIGETARLLALANLAMADAAITVWDSKLHYDFWRPITAIREAHTDPNRFTVSDPLWTPFIQSVHFPAGSQTPPYPDYTSGANGVTGAVTAMLQLFFRTDELDFEVYKATPAAVPICTNPRVYRHISDAAQEVVDARILLGIHFRFADEEARKQGQRVALWAFSKYLRPLRHHDRR